MHRWERIRRSVVALVLSLMVLGLVTSTPAQADPAPAGWITGYFIKPGGGAPGANYLRVSAYPVNASGVVSGVPLGGSNAADNGYFAIPVPAGQYKLFVRDGLVGHETFANQWYPAASAASAGVAIPVTSGAVTAGHNMVLSEPSTLTIKLFHAGKPTGGAIDVFDADGRFVISGTQLTADTSIATGLRSGSYRVKAYSAAATPYAAWYTFKSASAIHLRAGVDATVPFTLAFPTLTVVKRPRLVRTGTVLEPIRATLSPKANPGFDLEWWRSDGKRLTSRTLLYRFTKSDIGKRIRVCEISYRSGYARGYACSDWSAVVKKA